jgi:hypothetical protein
VVLATYEDCLLQASRVVVFEVNREEVISYLDGRNRRHSDKENNMVDFLIMSLLVTLCLERNPVNLQEPVSGSKVATGRTTIAVYEASIVGVLVER